VFGPFARKSTSAAFFSPGDDCLRQIIVRFREARRTVDVCVFTITDDRITRALLDAHHRGVKLRIITDNDKAYDRGSDIDRIAREGVLVKMDRTAVHMHHKFAIFDGKLLINGSYNWTRSAAEENLENIVESGDLGLIAAFQAEFDKLWRMM
jgi:phosphatidylserine/phosphatidylglycerophosphate/cardiolipin synthase-like enzyme